jgi:hypothetical protein
VFSLNWGSNEKNEKKQLTYKATMNIIHSKFSFRKYFPPKEETGVASVRTDSKAQKNSSFQFSPNRPKNFNN